METNLELSKNLKLTYVTENNWKDGKLIAVQCYFTFFGEHGEAFIVLEDDDNWQKIVSVVKEYIKQWELENAE